MKRLLILPAVAVLCTAEIWRRGFAAPTAYGVATCAAACGVGGVMRRLKTETEADPVG